MNIARMLFDDTLILVCAILFGVFFAQKGIVWIEGWDSSFVLCGDDFSKKFLCFCYSG